MSVDVPLARPAEPMLRPAGARPLRPRAFAALVVHLAVRELKSSHHLTLLGWAWPVVKQLAQLAVLVFLFGKIFDFDIENYPVFVFVGLMAWTWFSGGVTGAASSVLTQRHLVMQPRLPSSVLPIVAVAVPLVDVLFALPVLVLMLVLSAGLSWGLLLCPLLLVLQFVLIAGLAWAVAGVSVFFRDVPNLVGVALMILFYLTPVFYPRDRVPERFRWVIDLNPVTTIIEAYRSLLLGAPGPGAWRLGAVAAASVAIALVGHRIFARMAPRFADYL
jgi:homopolymeric O-antigen transport system permease protein